MKTFPFAIHPNAMRAAALLTCGAGCTRTAATIQADDARPQVADVAPPAPPLARPVTRTRGPFAGGFLLESSSFAALEPIFVTIDAKNTSHDPITFDVGGDYRGSYFPVRYGVYMRDDAGKMVCDIRETPPMSFGGLGGPRKLASGDRFHETFAVNSVCDALARPGRYTMTVVRRFTNQFSSDAGICDDMLASEAAPPGTSAACTKVLDAAPLIATDFAIEITPYNPKALAATLDPLVTAAKTAKDLGDHYERSLYFQWLCRHVTCSCMTGPAFTTAADLAPFMTTTLAKLPPKLPATLKCP